MTLEGPSVVDLFDLVEAGRRVISVLVQRLGGEVIIEEAELQAAEPDTRLNAKAINDHNAIRLTYGLEDVS